MGGGIQLVDVADPAHPAPVSSFGGDEGPGPGAGPPRGSLSFSRDGRTLVASTSGGTTFWDVGDPYRPRLAYSMNDVFSTVAFSPAGTTLVTSGPDNVIRFWDVPGPAHPTLQFMR
jgi:WD40 repeat protein